MGNLDIAYRTLELNSREIVVVKTQNGSACLYYQNEQVIVLWNDNYVLSDIEMGKQFKIIRKGIRMC